MLQRAKDTPAPPLAANVVTGDVAQPVATANRTEIESAATINLPVGVTQLDRAFQPQNGQTVAGGSLQNKYTGDGTYGRTLLCNPGVGFNYFSAGKVVGAQRFQLSDSSDSGNYRTGSPVYLWHLDGFQDGTGQLRTLHGVRSVSADAVTFLGPNLDPRLNSARWYQSAAVVGDVRQGQQTFNVPATLCLPGDWVYLTAGPDVANNDHGEWHRVVSVGPGTTITTATVQLETPTARPYSAAVLAKAQPVVGVTLRNLELLPPPGPLEAMLCKYAVNWRLDSVKTTGPVWFTTCAHCTFTNCVFENLNLNNCHDMSFIGCTVLNRVGLEETCFDVRFEGCVIGGVSTTTQCERLTFRGCRFTDFAGLTGPDMVADAITLDANVGFYLIGDRCRLSNIAGGFLFVQRGAGGLVQRCPGVSLGYPNWPSDGVCLDSPNSTVSAGTWRVIP